MAVFNATGLPNWAVMSEYRQGKLSLFSTNDCERLFSFKDSETRVWRRFSQGCLTFIDSSHNGVLSQTLYGFWRFRCRPRSRCLKSLLRIIHLQCKLTKTVTFLNIFKWLCIQLYLVWTKVLVYEPLSYNVERRWVNFCVHLFPHDHVCLIL